jgi:hypothetical protein
LKSIEECTQCKIFWKNDQITDNVFKNMTYV